MNENGPQRPTMVVWIAVLAMSAAAMADDMTRRVQKDLVTLGYDPGNISGEMTDNTIAAIAQFQAEHNLEVNGEVSPLLAGMLSAEVNRQSNPAPENTAPATAAPYPPGSTPATDPAALQAAQQACLQKKVAEAQEANKKKRGFGKLLSAVARTAGQSGDYDLARKTGDIYSASMTAEDLASAAEDLGLTESDVEECRAPTG